MATGFIGVDLFFVLSGFLITSGLLRDIRVHGRVRFARFWSRRFKRLMPAALLVLVTIFITAKLTASSTLTYAYSNDIWWTVFYLANWHFIDSASYFASDGLPKPLLHMWSLAVEEQFYIAWPVVVAAVLGLALLVARRAAATTTVSEGQPGVDERTYQRIVFWLIGATLALIALSVFLLVFLFAPGAPERAYMGTDTKMFEPLLGALVAMLMQVPRVQELTQKYARALSWGGAVGLGAIFIYLDGPEDSYYYYFALLFSLCAAIIIAGLSQLTAPTLLSGFLSWEPMAYLGRISYGIYLWHWPVAIALAADQVFSYKRAAATIVLTVASASLSYHLVEMPIRQGKISVWLSNGRTLFAGVCASVTVAGLATSLGGTPLSNLLLDLKEQGPADPDTVMVIGDSVPAGISQGFIRQGEKLGKKIVMETHGGCSPLAMHQQNTAEIDFKCQSVTADYKRALARDNPGVILWWSRFEIVDRWYQGRLLTPSDKDYWKAQLESLDNTLGVLTRNGATVVIVAAERPGKGMYTRPDCKSPTNCTEFYLRMMQHNGPTDTWNALLRKKATGNPKLKIISIDDYVCKDGANPCNDDFDGMSARKDGSHFRAEFVDQVAQVVLDRMFLEMGKK